MANVADMKTYVDLSKTTVVECESCGGKTFKQTMMLRKISAIVSPTGEESLIPVMVFACEHCGHVNKEFANSTTIAQ